MRDYNPDRLFSLQNKGISFYKKPQYVYFQLPFVLTDYKFRVNNDEKKLWFYQNILSWSIFKSLRSVNKTIVQTQWIKDALIRKARIPINKIEVLKPDISTNIIGKYDFIHRKILVSRPQ